MEKLVKLECIYDPKICFALQQNRVSPIKSIFLENLTDNMQTKLNLTITANPRFMEPLEINIQQLDGLEMIEITPEIDLSPDYLGSLDEKIAGFITLKLSSIDQVLYEQRMPIDVLSYDTWPGSSVLPEIISSFITPNRPFVGSIVKKASTLLQQETGSGSMIGYQSGDPGDVLRQLSAIFSVLQSSNISYSNPPASFEINGQKVRLPDTIEEQKLGTCLDTTLLFAACAEAIGIHSLIIFFDGHALPGFWLKEYFSSESYQDDRSIISKHMASGIHELIVVESTCITNQKNSFSEAIQLAQESIYKEGYFRFFIDVQRSRIGQITPIPIRSIRYSNEVNLDHEDIPSSEGRATFNMEHVDIIPEKKEECVELSLADRRIQQWQYSLLDLSLRNNLLNFRTHSQGIPLAVADIHLLEDLLAMGEKTLILPRPAEWETSVRNFDNNKDLITSNLLKDDMRNKRVRSYLSESELEKRLVALYRRAKNAMEESGSNSLFVAIGFLKWFESNTNKQQRFAPILLLPVELVRLSAKRGYYIRIRDEEIQINISLIEHLKQKFGIDASRLYDIPKDDHGADVKKVLTTMRRLIMKMDRWDVMENASIGVFSFSKFVMWYDLVHRTEELKKNKVVKSLMDGKSTWEANDSMYKLLSTEKDEEQDLFIPLSYDGTQMEAVLAASSDNSFVLHGPPGSGKSQTITNMISQALASGKTVLFVAEKMAALNVVHNRLVQLGIDPFCLEVYSNKAQKKDVLQQLEVSFSIQGKARDTDWQQLSDDMKMHKKQLNDHIRALHSKTNLGESIFEMIENYSKINDQKISIELDRDIVSNMDESTFKRNREDVRNLKIAGEDCGDLQKNPWLGLKRETYSLELYDLISERLQTIHENSLLLSSITDELSMLLGIQSSNRNFRFFTVLFNIANNLLKMPRVNVALIDQADFNQFKSNTLKVLGIGKLRDELRATVLQLFDETVVQLDADQLLTELRTAENSWVLPRLFGRKKVARILKGYMDSGKLTPNNLREHLDDVRTLKEYNSKLLDYNQPMQEFFEKLWNYSEGNWHDIQEALVWTEQVRQDLMSIVEDIKEISIFTSLLQKEKEAELTILKAKIEEYISLYNRVWDAWKTVITELNFPEVHQPEHMNWVQGSIEQSLNLLNSLDMLKSMCNLSRVVQEIEAKGLSNITKPYLQGVIAAEELENCYLYSFYRMRIDTEIMRHSNLSTFSKNSFEEKIEQFARLDEELRELAKIEVYIRLMENAPNLQMQPIVNSEPGILTRAIKSKGRGISIRNLFEKIPNLLPKIKPCMLMSPLSVAQYLNPDFPLFDLVIFDEASQLPTSEAIGAMARGKNVIVVGDPRQLPPTSFFKSQKVEDEEFEAQDLESVLDDCLAIHMPQKHLRWHYRSEHESLISFSNNHFYENRLITIPSVDDQQSRISFRKVQGVYDRGKTKQNKMEAEQVVEEVFNRLSDPVRQYESIGIVTFSQVQQTLIEDLIDERLKHDSTYEKYFTDEVSEPVFVKNLENVQGDERDIILFSIGYGPDADGYLTMNFGPLNREGGWRRLNVAVSRARKEMVIFASMEPEEINLSRTNSEGLKALKSFMEFAIKGNEPLLFENRKHKIRANSNVIAEKVSEYLRKHGYKVERNLGNSDFKIDLAVKDSENKGSYIAAIQIDGYNYGEVITPRDREKLRNELLQKLGWKVIKLWSIEWWHNEQKQLDGLLQSLRELKANPLEPGSSPSKHNQATENQPSIEERISQLMIIDHEDGEIGVIYKPIVLESVVMPNEYFYTDDGVKIIAKQINEIIHSEAPISFSQLTNRIIEAWGFSRSGAKIEQVIDEILQYMNVAVTFEKKGKFLWKSNEQVVSFSLFRRPDKYRRPAADICLQEYIHGILEILSTSFQLPREDLIREVSKKAGYARSGKALAEYVNEGIHSLIDSGIIAENGENLIYKGN